jgi:diguanylate cyclase (GGDEF)-like protein
MMMVWAALLAWWLWINERRFRQRMSRTRLAQSPVYDTPLELPNRAALVKLLDTVLGEGEHACPFVGVLYVDLDNFKLTNNSLGHAAGDQVLRIVAGHLRASVQPTDEVAHIGADEFAVMVRSSDTEQDVVEIAQQIANRIRQPVLLDEHEVFVTASIGIAFAHPNECTADRLLHDAYAAMCHAKARGNGRYQIFDARVDNGALARLTLESDMRRAVQRGEFCIEYQPIVSLATGIMVEVEALVRWDHPRRGVLLPAEFIAVAEETGLILPIGYLVLREACRQARAWHQEFPDHPIQVSVNLSARQFQYEGLVAEVAEILAQTSLQPEYLKLEITESVLMHDVASTLDTLRQLKALGVRLAVDDFGTGYSSLNYLTRFPVDVLKIDRSFVDRLDLERESTAIISAIITLANSLGLEVVGEGLERAEQPARLRALGCDRGQGYYFARPLPSEGIRALCASPVLTTAA